MAKSRAESISVLRQNLAIVQEELVARVAPSGRGITFATGRSDRPTPGQLVNQIGELVAAVAPALDYVGKLDRPDRDRQTRALNILLRLIPNATLDELEKDILIEAILEILDLSQRIKHITGSTSQPHRRMAKQELRIPHNADRSSDAIAAYVNERLSKSEKNRLLQLLADQLSQQSSTAESIPRLDSFRLPPIAASAIPTEFKVALRDLELLVHEALPDHRTTKVTVTYANRLIEVINSAADRPKKAKQKQKLVDALNSLRQALNLDAVLTEGTEKIPSGTKVSFATVVQPPKYPEGRYILSASKRDPHSKKQPALARVDRLPIRLEVKAGS